MEDDRKDKTRETIDDRDMVSNIGYFLMSSVVQALNVSKKIDLFALDEAIFAEMSMMTEGTFIGNAVI